MNLHFNLPWAGRVSVKSYLNSNLDATSTIQLDQAPKKLPFEGHAPVPAPVPDNGFSFPITVQNSPLKLFSRKNSSHPSGSDDSHPVSNSSASISEGFGTSSEEDGVTLSAPRPAALLLHPPAPRLSPLLSTTDIPLGAPSGALQRLEAASLVIAMRRHSLQLRPALVILGYQDLWPSDHSPHRSIEGTLAGMLALARRANAQPRELTPYFMLTLLWLLHAFDNQVGGWASDVVQRFTALQPPRERVAAQAALQQGMLDLQGPLLERCGWRVRLMDGEVAMALAELRGCPGFLPWCAEAHVQLVNLIQRRPPRVHTPVFESPLSKFDAGAPNEALLSALAQMAGQACPGVALGPSTLLGSQTGASISFFPAGGVTVSGVQATAQGEGDGRQPWRKRLRNVDSTIEPPRKHAQRASMASRFHTALRGMFGGGGGGGRAPVQNPLPGELADICGSENFVEE